MLRPIIQWHIKNSKYYMVSSGPLLGRGCARNHTLQSMAQWFLSLQWGLSSSKSTKTRFRSGLDHGPRWGSLLDWSGTWLPDGGLSARRRRQRSPTSISRHSDLCHAPHVQHLRRPMLRSCRSTAMELAANQSKTVSQSGTIQAFVKDIPVYCVRPRRLVTCLKVRCI